jgi:predicted ester cyclase
LLREWAKIDCDKTNLYTVWGGFRQHRVGAQSPLPDIFAEWNIGIWKLKELHVDNQQALKLLHRYHDATNAGTLDELDHLFAEDFTNFAAGFEPVRSLAAMKTHIRELLLAFPDWHVTVEDMFAQGNKVVTRWSLDATHLAPYRDISATGFKIHAEGIHIDHIVDDKIAKRWAVITSLKSSTN